MTAIGITGTRTGCNASQLAELREKLALYQRREKAVYLHHGDCVGVDSQAHEIALEFGWLIEVHPPLDNKFRAYTTGWYLINKESPYRARNQAIVDRCDVLLAVPEGPDTLHPRSGTWMTVRMAQRAGKKCYIIRGDRW